MLRAAGFCVEDATLCQCRGDVITEAEQRSREAEEEETGGV